MTLKTFSCATCSTNVVFDVSMNAPKEEQEVQHRWCPTCEQECSFNRVWAPVAFAFGMYTERYTGQAAAVSGWGTHVLDYGKGKSDLVAGRATEAAKKRKPEVRGETF